MCVHAWERSTSNCVVESKWEHLETLEFFIVCLIVSESIQCSWAARFPTCQSLPSAVGVACELSPASLHWSHAGQRGVFELCHWLTWCTAEGLLVSSLSTSPVPFLSKLVIWRTHWGVRRGATLHTFRYEWPTWHTWHWLCLYQTQSVLVCHCVLQLSEHFWQLHVVAAMSKISPEDWMGKLQR